MQELVNAGLLASVPTSPDASKYCYYDYGVRSVSGALMVTSLLNTPISTTGIGNSCRPYTTNWCSYTNPSRYYCICNPY